MTEAIRKLLPPEYLAILTLLGSVFGYIHSTGYGEAEREALRRDITRQQGEIATLQRQVGGLYAHIRRLQNWPSRTSEPSMKTDAQ